MRSITATALFLRPAIDGQSTAVVGKLFTKGPQQVLEFVRGAGAAAAALSVGISHLDM